MSASWLNALFIDKVWRNGVEQPATPLEFIGQSRNVLEDPTTKRLKAIIRDPGTINVCDPPYSAVGDGVTDDTAAIQAAYAVVAATGGTLMFPGGVYRANLDLAKAGVVLRGAGVDTTVIRPFDPTKPAIILSWGTWGTMCFRDMTIKGYGTPGNYATASTGVQFGHSPAHANDALVVDVEFRNVNILDFRKCIDRLYGNMQLYVKHCSFQGADFHIHTVEDATSGGTSGGPAPAGCAEITDSTFVGAEIASHYIKGLTYAGQYTIKDCILESNPGVIVFSPGWKASGNVGMSIDNCWMENNGAHYAVPTASVTIDGVPYAPSDLLLIDSYPIHVRNTMLMSVDARGNTAIDATDCVYSDIYAESITSGAIVMHKSPRAYAANLARSYTDSPKLTTSNASIYRLQHPTKVVNGLASNTAFSLVGDAPCATQEVAPYSSVTYPDGPIVGASQQFDLVVARQVCTFPSFPTLTAKQYAWTLTYRLTYAPISTGTDWSCAAAGTGAWTAGGGATITKQATAPMGANALRVAGASTWSFQTGIVSVGKHVRWSGYARSVDGVSLPMLMNSSLVPLWTGTASTNWQPFDVETTTDGTSAPILYTAGGTATEWYGLTPGIRGPAPNLILSGTVGLSSVCSLSETDWTTIGTLLPGACISGSGTGYAILSAATAGDITSVQIAGMQVMTFDALTAARYYLESGQFSAPVRARLVMGAAAPTVGVWRTGDRIINSAPASGQPCGWRCVSSGNPGTWIAEANL